MPIAPALYLIPVGLSDCPTANYIPPYNLEVIAPLRHFIVENVRTARRFLRRCLTQFPIDECTFVELNGHTDPLLISSFLDPLRAGRPIGLMSEAGCPAVADPGAQAVAIAQRENLRVVPLVGPSSILMALMCSGFNGQGFSFHGYLPIDPAQRARTIRDLEAASARTGMTQIFIETPYRNDKMIATLADTLKPDTLLCVAAEITDPDREKILTLPAAKWKNLAAHYKKVPAIFLIQKQ